MKSNKITYDDTKDASIRVIEKLINLGKLEDNDDHYFEVQDTIQDEFNELLQLDIDDNFEWRLMPVVEKIDDQDIRSEIQNWLELVSRVVKNIPFEEEVDWEDIEDVYNGSHSDAVTPKYIAYNGEVLSFETVYCDAITMDHMCSEVLNGDFEEAMRIPTKERKIKCLTLKY